MEALSWTINSVGTVSMVSTKFAYITTAKGTVFCPLAASVAPDEIVPDMTKRYTVGDTVRVEAVQQESKNNCPYRAKKMRLIRQSQATTGDNLGEPSISLGTPCSSTVGHIDSAFIIADSVEFGCIFVPRSIFGPLEKDYPDLQPGDTLNIIIRSQPERNNCKWVAVAVQEIIKATYIQEQFISGSGIVQNVDQMSAEVYSMFHGMILCPIINWTGGDLGTDAVGLDEIIRIGDQIAFEAVIRNDIYRATRWSFLNELKKRPVNKMDTYTQTMPSLQDYVIRLLRPQLEEMQDEKPMVKIFLQSLNDDDIG